MIVKETKTNMAGEYLCFLPAGKYVIEYFLENVINTGMEFTVAPDQKLLRMAAPQQG